MTLKMTCHRCLLVASLFVGSILPIQVTIASADAQEEVLNENGFMNPPLAARPGAFWAWLEGHVSLERITYELEEMKAKGMGGADIWDVHAYINPGQMIPAGPTFLGDESVKAIAHTLREAKRLGLNMGMVAASGWNAGGTWVEPADAGMGLFHSQVSVSGPATFSQVLAFPELPKDCPKDAKGRPLFYRNVAVLAVPQAEDKTLESTDSVVDLTRYCDKRGHLTWDVPAGKWTIFRFIMSNTGYQLIAQSLNSGGPMIDFLNPDSTRMHFGHILDRLESELGDISNFPLDHLEVDSMELGHHTIWTAQIIERFKTDYGYDPLKYLPLLKGWKTKDVDITQRFLYDWKKLISDVFIDNHYRTGSDFLRKHGVKLCAEAGGPGAPIWDSCPVDSLKALGTVDILRGEFWPKMRNIWLVKEISSAAHIYGKTIVDAESFTSWRHLQDGPYFYKLMADRAMGEGLNHFTFHTFAHSPNDAGLPGNYYHAGTHINPNRVWWPMAKSFIDYLSRCCYMLQKGLFVADACYYYGDQAPKFVSAKGIDYCPGDGYDYDVVNSDVILNRMTVKNGRIVLPDGMSYAVLVLPERSDMDLDVLRKLASMVKAGATVIGPKPDQTGTLMDYPKRDGQVARLADRLWGDCDGQSVKEYEYGKGRILWNRSVAEVLRGKGIEQDFRYTGSDQRTHLDYVHRRTDREDIYFVINLNERWERVDCAFRVQGKRPQLWHPETGQLSDIPAYDIKNEVTHLTLHLKPAESVFIVFREPAAPTHFTHIETLESHPVEAVPTFSPHSATPGGPMWLSDGETEVADQHITFDLGATHPLKKISIWNYIEPVRGFMNYGIKGMEIRVSANGTDFRACGTFSLNEASQTEDKHYHQDLAVQIDNARYVRFDVKTNHNTDWYANGISKHVGLSRVTFFGDHEISGVTIHSVSSGTAFEPASDDTMGPARPDSELKMDAANRPYLRVWTPGTYVLNKTGGSSEKVEVPSITRPLDITGPWQVSFTPGRGAPDRTRFEQLISWTNSEDDGIKYFSGRAVYNKEFDIPKTSLSENATLELDLGVVHKVARVSLNGQDIAVLWKPPFSVDITDRVKPGKNTLTVEVANTWTNRLIGDAFGPPDKQVCRTNLHEKLSRKDRRLQPSGLLGPVTIHTATHVYSNGPAILKVDALRDYVHTFNSKDHTHFGQAISNESAADWMADNVPLFECPDKEMEEIYHFRWWTFRKHIKKTPDGFVITEFLPKVNWSGKHNTISCPAGHHFREGRWIHAKTYLDDYALFWFRKGGSPRRYSFWAADTIYQQALALGDFSRAVDLLPDLVTNYEAWEESRLEPDGLFWQIDDRDGMEVSIGGSGHRGQGKRATINSYMYGDAQAIAAIAERANKPEITVVYRNKAERIKRLVLEKLWDEDAKFFKILPRGARAALVDVRELHGFTPWYFNLPDQGRGYEVAWKQLMDPKGFYAPFGPTVAEQRHPRFAVSYKGHECQWNGPSWPFATAVTLTALANVLNDYTQQAVSSEDYFETLKSYTKSHRLKHEDETIVPWIDENLNPHTGDWIARTRLKAWKNGTWDQGKGGVERGKDYNHSSYCDLIITGLVGLRPREDDIVEVNPLLPDGAWDYFCLDRVPYHGRMLTILYDKTGAKYRMGSGLRILADGKEIGAIARLGRLTAPLPPRSEIREKFPKNVHFDPVIKNMEGWTVHIDPQMLEGEYAEVGGRALTMLTNHLQRITILMPKERLQEMRTLGIWIEHDHPDINVEPGPYHPGVGWLTERGYDPRLAKKVHVTRAASLLERHHMLKHPAVILHELVHAYHHQVLGFDEPRIKAAYDQAMKAGLYEKVLLYTGQTVRHYAATNHMEYFAEGTEAYFYRNDFYPFVRAELKEHDPVLHGLLEDIWGPVK